MRIVGTNLPEDAWINPVAVATTGSNISLVAGQQTIDGVLVGQYNSGDPRVQRVLVKDQTSAVNNGIYNATADIAWSRALDANDKTQWALGVQLVVTGGTINGGAAFRCTSAGTNNQIIPGTTPLTFTSSYALPATAQALQKPASAATITISANWLEVGIDTRSTAVTVNLPSIATWAAANPFGLPLSILDYYGNAATNNITPVPNGTDAFQWGGVTPLIESNFGILRLRPDVAAGKWMVIQAS
jgi:hypothetical protein